jgi:hypothetical protein
LNQFENLFVQQSREIFAAIWREGHDVTNEFAEMTTFVFIRLAIPPSLAEASKKSGVKFLNALGKTINE